MSLEERLSKRDGFESDYSFKNSELFFFSAKELPTSSSLFSSLSFSLRETLFAFLFRSLSAHPERESECKSGQGGALSPLRPVFAWKRKKRKTKKR